ncbi:MAG: class II aldolase/adducin family protein, partial [Bacteroidetes bacterium]|nr:class II aldolase/adducin family protein [Bacteroidota bacterium]
MTKEEAKQLVCESGKKLLSEGLVTGTWGNVSVKVDEHTMVITPSGRKYDELTPEEMVVVNIRTLEYEGGIKPSSELKLHAEIFKQRKNITAVIHTHQ